MNSDSLIQTLTERVEALIASEPAFFLVDIRIKPTNNIKVYLDGDEGISIEKLVSLNRRLYRQLDESGIFPGGDFSLEVSSPGLDEPLKMHRQYVKNKGRFVEVILQDGSRVEGLLKEVGDSEIMIEEQKGKHPKKKEIVNHTIGYEKIKSTKIQIKF